jgi:hypothetical protein
MLWQASIFEQNIFVLIPPSPFEIFGVYYCNIDSTSSTYIKLLIVRSQLSNMVSTDICMDPFSLPPDYVKIEIGNTSLG